MHYLTPALVRLADADEDYEFNYDLDGVSLPYLNALLRRCERMGWCHAGAHKAIDQKYIGDLD